MSYLFDPTRYQGVKINAPHLKQEYNPPPPSPPIVQYDEESSRRDKYKVPRSIYDGINAVGQTHPNFTPALIDPKHGMHGELFQSSHTIQSHKFNSFNQPSNYVLRKLGMPERPSRHPNFEQTVISLEAPTSSKFASFNLQSFQPDVPDKPKVYQGSFVNHHTGEVIDILTEQLPPPDTTKGYTPEVFQHTKRRNPNIARLQGGYDERAPRLTKTEVLADEPRMDAGPNIFGDALYVKRIRDRQDEDTKRHLFFNRDGISASTHKMAEIPIRPGDISFTPYIPPTEELDRLGSRDASKADPHLSNLSTRPVILTSHALGLRRENPLAAQRGQHTLGYQPTTHTHTLSMPALKHEEIQSMRGHPDDIRQGQINAGHQTLNEAPSQVHFGQQGMVFQDVAQRTKHNKAAINAVPGSGHSGHVNMSANDLLAAQIPYCVTDPESIRLSLSGLYLHTASGNASVPVEQQAPSNIITSDSFVHTTMPQHKPNQQSEYIHALQTNPHFQQGSQQPQSLAQHTLDPVYKQQMAINSQQHGGTNAYMNHMGATSSTLRNATQEVQSKTALLQTNAMNSQLHGGTDAYLNQVGASSGTLRDAFQEVQSKDAMLQQQGSTHPNVSLSSDYAQPASNRELSIQDREANAYKQNISALHGATGHFQGTQQSTLGVGGVEWSQINQSLLDDTMLFKPNQTAYFHSNVNPADGSNGASGSNVPMAFNAHFNETSKTLNASNSQGLDYHYVNPDAHFTGGNIPMAANHTLLETHKTLVSRNNVTTVDPQLDIGNTLSCTSAVRDNASHSLLPAENKSVMQQHGFTSGFNQNQLPSNMVSTTQLRQDHQQVRLPQRTEYVESQPPTGLADSSECHTGSRAQFKDGIIQNQRTSLSFIEPEVNHPHSETIQAPATKSSVDIITRRDAGDLSHIIMGYTASQIHNENNTSQLHNNTSTTITKHKVDSTRGIVQRGGVNETIRDRSQPDQIIQHGNTPRIVGKLRNDKKKVYGDNISYSPRAVIPTYYGEV